MKKAIMLAVQIVMTITTRIISKIARMTANRFRSKNSLKGQR